MEFYSTPLAQSVIACAIEVHQTMGPGLLESTYQRCLAKELSLRQLAFDEQVAVPAEYKGMELGVGYRLDFVIEEQLIVELKAVEKLLPLHNAQMMTYLRLTGLRQGLLINFNAATLKDGLRSILNARATKE